MSAMEHEDEPVPGLPQELPEGESIVWQGSPAWRPLARNVFKTRWVAAYFAVLVVARVVMLVSSGEDMTSAAESLSLKSPNRHDPAGWDGRRLMWAPQTAFARRLWPTHTC